MQAPQHQVSVSDRQISILPVTDRSWMRPRGFRTNFEQAVPKKQTGTSSGRYCLDVHLRSLDAYPGSFRFMHQFVILSVT